MEFQSCYVVDYPCCTGFIPTPPFTTTTTTILPTTTSTTTPLITTTTTSGGGGLATIYMTFKTKNC
jgi:hypothetical protein